MPCRHSRRGRHPAAGERRSLFALPVGRRRDAHDAGEQTREVGRVVESEHLCNLSDFQVRKLDVLTGALDFQLQQVADGRHARLALEEHRKVRGRVTEMRGQLLERGSVADVLLHVADDLPREGEPEVRPAARRIVGLRIEERGEQVVQAGRRVAHVVDGVGEREALVKLLEEVQPLLDARLAAGLDVARCMPVGAVAAAVPALEVEPIDCPRILVVGPQLIGDIGRKNGILVLAERVAAPVDAVPPLAFGAVEQHGVVASLLLKDVVVLHTGEVADFPQIEIPDERVGGVCVEQRVGQRDEAFVLESLLDSEHGVKS